MLIDLDEHLIKLFGEVAPVILPPSRILEHDPFDGLPVLRGTTVKARSETVLKLRGKRLVFDKPRTRAPGTSDNSDDARGPKSDGKNRGLSREQQGKPPLELERGFRIIKPKANQAKPHGNTDSPKWATIDPQYRYFFSWVFLNNFYEKLETNKQKIKAEQDLGDIKGYFYGWAAEAATSNVRNRLSRLRIRSTLILGSGFLFFPPSAIQLIPAGKLSLPPAQIDFTKGYLHLLPDEIWHVLEEMRYDACAQLRDSTDPDLSDKEADEIKALPFLSHAEKKEVRRTMKKIWRQVYKSSARANVLRDVAAEHGVRVEDLFPISSEEETTLDKIADKIATFRMRSLK